jgi:gluconate kinase
LTAIDAETARCSGCGTSQRVRRRPVFVVSGASGAGKTTVFPHLVDALPECVVVDGDYLLDAVGHDDPPRLRNVWLSVAHAVAQGDRSVVLCGPFSAEHLADLPARRWISEVHFAVLDCPERVLRERLFARPAWRESRHKIDEHVRFAQWLRSNIDVRVSTVDRTPDEVAADLAGWVRSVIAAGSA